MEITNKIKVVLISLVSLIILTACGGGSAEINTAPTVNIVTKNSSVLEGMSIELNASASDAQNDELTYTWTQLNGEKVSLVNDKSLKPSFIAPNVSSDANVTLELLVSDGKEENKSTISINIIDEPKETKRHEVLATQTSVTKSSDTFTVTYNYNRTPITEVTSGLVLNVYWDSSKVEYGEFKEIFSTDYMGFSTIKDDNDDKDRNSDTDKYITISWVNLDGNWEVPTPLPKTLFSVVMKAKSAVTGTSVLNIQTNVDSPNLAFYSQSVILNFME